MYFQCHVNDVTIRLYSVSRDLKAPILHTACTAWLCNVVVNHTHNTSYIYTTEANIYACVCAGNLAANDTL
jgi:hypothetical protein